MDSDCGLQCKGRRKGGGDQSANGMESLPYQIILDILSRLPLSSLVRCRYVCRSWRMFAQDQHLIDNLHNSNTAENRACLIFHCDNPIRNQLYFVDYPFDHRVRDTVKKIHTPFCVSMPEFEVVGSCNGLMCLSDSLHNDAIYIYNPFTGDYRELPKSMPYPNQKVIYGFGFHPVTKEYKVVKIIRYRPEYRGPWLGFGVDLTQSEVQVFTLGSSTWRSVEETYHHLRHSPAQVLVNGRIHWVSMIRRYHRIPKLISFDLEDEKFREVPKPHFDGLKRRDYHLLVLKGCLATVFYCSFGKLESFGELEIWIMKEYDVKESWVKEFSIGSHIPKALKQDVDRSGMIFQMPIQREFVRVLCVLMNGQILLEYLGKKQNMLLEYKSRALVLYDPNSGTFEDIVFQGLPKCFQTVVHVGRLNQIHTLVNM